MNRKRQAEKTAEAFAAGFLDDAFGHDLFLGSQIERLLAEKVHVIYQYIEDELFYGAAITHETGEKFVVLNSFHPLRIRYFTAAHELWHLLEASEMQSEEFDHERAADRFAACLMLPKPLVLSLWHRFKNQFSEEHAVLFIADLAAAPYKTVERRMKEVGEKIKVSYSEHEWRNIRENYSLPLSPLDLAIHDTQFRAYEKQVLMHVEEGLHRLSASNKLAVFAPKISEALRQEELADGKT